MSKFIVYIAAETSAGGSVEVEAETLREALEKAKAQAFDVELQEQDSGQFYDYRITWVTERETGAQHEVDVSISPME